MTFDPATIPPTGTCDLTTTGRRTGRARTVEIWYVVHDGRLHVVGSPGRRDWHANLAADPRATLRLHHPDVTLRVAATLVRDPDERARVTDTAWKAQPWYGTRGFTREDWIDRAPMVVLAVVDGPGDA